MGDSWKKEQKTPVLGLESLPTVGVVEIGAGGLQ